MKQQPPARGTAKHPDARARERALQNLAGHREKQCRAGGAREPCHGHSTKHGRGEEASCFAHVLLGTIPAGGVRNVSKAKDRAHEKEGSIEQICTQQSP